MMQKQKQSLFRRFIHSLVISFFITLFICSLLFLGAYFIFGEKKMEKYINTHTQAELPSTTTQQNTTESTEAEPSTLLLPTSEADDSYFDDMIFLGDSRTVAMEQYGYIKAENTFAENGINHQAFQHRTFTDTVSQTVGTYADIIQARQPGKVYVALGINGVAFMEESLFMEEYATLIDTIKEASPNSKIIIQSILPVKNFQTHSSAHMTNESIDYYNGLLLNLAEEKEVYFLNLAPELKTTENELNSIYDTGDGLHFKQETYDVILQYIKTHQVPE